MGCLITFPETERKKNGVDNRKGGDTVLVKVIRENKENSAYTV